jgi:hypothetical protein
VVYLRAATLSSIVPINSAAASIAGYGNFGTPTHLFCSQLTQSDFDSGLDPAFRVPLTDVHGGGTQLGAPVKGIRTSWGDIANMPDVFIRDGDQFQPFENLFPIIAAANAFAPAGVAVAANAVDAASKFTAPQAGNYYYYVTGINASGQSIGTKSAQLAIAAGGSATLTISRSAGAQETGYVIYRSRLNGGNNTVLGLGLLSDFRQMIRIPVAGATTVYTDQNLEIPGTSKAFMLNMTPGAQAITWRQLLPMLKFPLYPTVSAVIPWAQLMFGYLRIGKRRHHAVFKNVLPNSAAWRPFN